ncbi:MAG: hypothetical protein JSW46_06440 [Gemmatimonadota bacterium]|nr:MAG: hypothetical protein JSW46_06440 [Gemmatimonadota bacterium]
MRPTRGFLVMLAIGVTALAIMATIDYFRPIPPDVQLRALRSQLSTARGAADSCQAALNEEEARLRTSDAHFDSLKSMIDYYEGLDSRGVPADSYDIYIAIFNDYNDAIPAREAAGDTLRAHEKACHAIIERHNVIADSAMALARELGVLRDTSTTEPAQ